MAIWNALEKVQFVLASNGNEKRNQKKKRRRKNTLKIAYE